MDTSVLESDPIFSVYEKGLELPAGIILGLLKKDNDWAFLIKTHALVDAALSEILVSELKRNEIVNYIKQLNWSGATGKVKLAEELGILEPSQRQFLEVLNFLRNKVAHDIQEVDFDMVGYFGCNTNESRGQLNKISSGMSQVLKSETKLIEAVFSKHPRLYLFTFVVIFLAMAFHKKNIKDKSPEKIASDFGEAMAHSG